LITDWPLFNRIIFYPRTTEIKPSFPVDVEGISLGCHMQRPFPDAGVVLYFHGNGELAAECDRFLARMFLDMGINVCFVEYRGYGASGGTPSLAAMLGDGERVVEALGIPHDRIVAFGRSIGSLYAIELARRLPRLGGLILESGIANLLDLSPIKAWGTLGKCISKAAVKLTPFNNQAKMKSFNRPVLILHTEGDYLVPRSHADRLYAWSRSPEKRLVMFPNGDHNSILNANAAEYVESVGGFLRGVGITNELKGSG